VRELHREFLRSGADVMQALTFYASDDKLQSRGNNAHIMYTVRESTVLNNNNGGLKTQEWKTKEDQKSAGWKADEWKTPTYASRKLN